MTRTPLSNPEARPAHSGIRVRRWVSEFANALIWLIGMNFRAVRLASGWPLICDWEQGGFHGVTRTANKRPRH